MCSDVARVSAVICDLDGTLSDARHRRHFMDQDPPHWKGFYDALGDDPINKNVHHLISNWQTVILLSGRPSDYRYITEVWLALNHVRYEKLLMRTAGDYRKDHIIKAEIYREQIEPHYDVQLVLDDRASVVEMWRGLGLECWQVAEGKF